MSGLKQLSDHPDLKLTARRRRMELVVELFHSGKKSTFEIAHELGLSEQDVCDLLDDAGRGGW
ncbi:MULTISPECIES: hypothetical protein [Rhizobium/Agrobacterium group]|uniref:hypothetical protein n=1 Tax=Rhizobium/Agrobacterium group TaxID=227290 RepID=UPI00030C8F7F|nr:MULTISPECIES: hypothetical protein [Rhizobium/Agrobacterium group]MUO30801.1 hypothetical protein [Agrobacterium vitis]